MKASDFNTQKFKCSICDKSITMSNVGEHALCLQTAHGYESEFSFSGVFGLFLANNWVSGPYGQDAQFNFSFELEGVEGTIVTWDPLLTLMQYALVVKGKEKPPRKPKDEIPTSQPEPIS